MKTIAFDPVKCSLCGACSLLCSLVKSQGDVPAVPRIRIETAGNCLPLRAAVCQHCTQPACVDACMRGIIHKDAATGIVTRQQEDCFRCASCAVYCPVGACAEDDATQAFVSCDLCGGDPLCVKICLSGALQYADEREISVLSRRSYAKKTFEAPGEAPKERTSVADLTDAQWQEICRLAADILGKEMLPDLWRSYAAQLRNAAKEEGLHA